MIKEWLHTPVLSPVLRSRRIHSLLSTAAVLQIGLAAAGLHGWLCPFKTALGIPCPGCGLTSAMAALVCGNWRLAIIIHPFAPGFLAASLLLLIFSLLSGATRARVVRTVEAVERRTGIIICIVISFGIHWSLRIIGSF